MARLQPDRERASYRSAKERCENPARPKYPRYGGRGIEFRFSDFWDFYNYMGPRPVGKTLDRIDNDGHYEKGNLRWATRKEQQRNTEKIDYITFKGQTLCTSEWAEIVGLRRETLRSRIVHGWSVERALTTPVRKRVLSPS